MILFRDEGGISAGSWFVMGVVIVCCETVVGRIAMCSKGD